MPVLVEFGKIFVIQCQQDDIGCRSLDRSEEFLNGLEYIFKI